MVISDGYCIEYYPKANRLVIDMPQTVTTINNTTAMVSNRRTDIHNSDQLMILLFVKVLMEKDNG